MKRRVVITGTGLVSALGDDAAGVHGSLCAGRHAFGEELFDGREGCPPARAARVRGFRAAKWLGDVNVRPLERTGQLSVCGALLALEAGGWTPEKRRQAEMGLLLATAFSSVETIARYDRDARRLGPRHASPLDFANTVLNAAAGQTAIWHGLTGPNTTVCAGGKTAGLCALRDAARRIASGLSDATLVGGVEGFCFETHTAFAQSGHLQPDAVPDYPVPFARGRQGFLLGEGSAFAVLEDAGAAAARGARVLAELEGWGSGFDPAGGREQRSAVAACARAIREALSRAGLPPGEIGFACSSACGSVAGDPVEILALAEVFGDRLAALPLFAPAAALGETLGASGLIQTVLLVETLRAGCVPGTIGADRYDPRLPPAGVSTVPRRGTYRHGLGLSQGFDGSSAAVVVTAGG